MKIYASQGFLHFILALGYRGEDIKRYFLEYDPLTRDFTLTLGIAPAIKYHDSHPEEGWRITFADTPFARETFKLYAEGFLRGWSVGFIPEEWEVLTDDDNKFSGYHITAWELLELSAVPVPANPQALTDAIRDGKVRTPALVKALRGAVLTHRVIPFRPTKPDPEDSEWDAAEEVKAADVSDLKVMCAWYDDAKPDVKESYKLPHHRAGTHRVVWKGVAATMGALLGARGGTDIPAGDRRGVYEHLAKHYKQFEKEPPEFKTPPRAQGGLSPRDDALLVEVISAMKTCVSALEIFAKDSFTGQDLRLIDLEAHVPGVDNSKGNRKENQSLFSFMQGDPTPLEKPEISVSHLADLIAPALMRGLREATRQAVDGEIRRRLGKLD